ncbi:MULTISPECIES: dicarboxylate/amino acid:cation symporter [Empedobacter]|uniref:Dicarboxylate/amino acid:cation symporter n=1 Tax=Empedobacter falsenii TaxID=343874 RepID=A0A7H9DWA3_9FLAO|nr:MULTISPECIES: dicarboxylate/amino acid:cation symporter [Empedobacter]MDH2205709.1 dicarboxylate/amino acid:cation symporter [Empedobacter sp. GD03644]QLL58991.1 dicarboxylate/amino acid:cation symporter [Empedobacter falsenii]
MLKKIASNTLFRLLLGVIAGLVLGNYLNENTIQIVLSLKYFTGQLIFFLVPLIVIGFIVSSITKLSEGSAKIVGFSLLIAYLSSIGAGLFSMIAGYQIIPNLSIPTSVDSLREVPKILFQLDIPPIFSVMTALVISLMLGMGILITKAKELEKIFDQFKDIVILLVNKVLIPILPFFIAANFAILSYEGSIEKQLPVFLKVILIVIVGHFIWMTLMYTIAGFYHKTNPFKLLKYYPPVYLTAVGTMSSAASLGVAVKAVNDSKVIKSTISNFTIPFFSNTHLCGSVLTEVFFVMTVSQVLYGHIPDVGTMVIFVLLLGVFAVGAPGVPGGTVVASLGLISNVLGFDEAGVALILTIFALQDSFGTACNITTDGALSMIVDKYAEEK